MRSLSILVLTAFLAGPVMAQTAPATVAPEKVLAAVTSDWNDDGSMDRAVLVDGDDGAGLIIYLSDGENGLKPAAYAPGLVSSGVMFGTLPDLKLSPSGGLQVTSENIGVGRDHWEQTLSLAWRDGQFVVAGITYTANDTLDPKAGGTCDINLLTGKGTANRKAVKLAPAAIPVSQWTDDKLPTACQF